MKLCARCGKEPVEVIEDWVSTLCISCADREIEREALRREWDYYHPGEPMPKSELPDAMPQEKR